MQPSWAMPTPQAMQRHSGGWTSLPPTEIPTPAVLVRCEAGDTKKPNATGSGDDPPPVAPPIVAVG